ncbi:cyclin-like protein [Paraphysoderma sedebokerense]|nr:cyclin-like protein [Paraphysoderma sedebokerense]
MPSNTVPVASMMKPANKLPPTKPPFLPPPDRLVRTPPQWIFSKEELMNCPSARRGMTPTDIKYRTQKGISIIHQIAQYLREPQVTIATASVFFHRFFMRVAFQDHEFKEVAPACLFLASKIEEHWVRMDNFSPAVAKIVGKISNPSPEDLKRWRNCTFRHEENILKICTFDMSVEHPYRSAIEICELIDSDQYSDVAKCAWFLINDSYTQPLCLMYQPQAIAAAALKLASEATGIPLKLRDTDELRALIIRRGIKTEEELKNLSSIDHITYLDLLKVTAEELRACADDLANTVITFNKFSYQSPTPYSQSPDGIDGVKQAKPEKRKITLSSYTKRKVTTDTDSKSESVSEAVSPENSTASTPPVLSATSPTDSAKLESPNPTADHIEHSSTSKLEPTSPTAPLPPDTQSQSIYSADSQNITNSQSQSQQNHHSQNSRTHSQMQPSSPVRKRKREEVIKEEGEIGDSESSPSIDNQHEDMSDQDRKKIRLDKNDQIDSTKSRSRSVEKGLEKGEEEAEPEEGELV